MNPHISLPTPEAIDALNSLDDMSPDFLKYAFAPGQDHTFYKVVSKDNTPSHHTQPQRQYFAIGGYLQGPIPGQFVYDPPKEDGSPGSWALIHNNPIICQHGIHFTSNPARWLSTQADAMNWYRLYIYEPRGIVDPIATITEDSLYSSHGNDKFVSATGRTLREIDLTDNAEWYYHVTRNLDLHNEHTKAMNEPMELKLAQVKREFLIKKQQERAEHYIEAASLSKIFVPDDINFDDFLTNFMAVHACPHCHRTIDGFRLEEERNVHSTETKILTFTKGGNYQEDYGDLEHIDSELDNSNLYYDCGGTHCLVEEWDFEDLLVFENRGESFQSFLLHELEAY